MSSNSSAVLVVGVVIVGYGLFAFNHAGDDRSAAGGLGSGLSPAGREFLSIVVIIFGLATMVAAVIRY